MLAGEEVFVFITFWDCQITACYQEIVPTRFKLLVIGKQYHRPYFQFDSITTIINSTQQMPNPKSAMLSIL